MDEAVTLRYVLFVVGLMTSLGVTAETITLSAKPGEFNAKALGNPSTRSALSASVQITKFTPSSGWPTAAYVGFFQGKDRSDSIQFLIIRNRESDSYVVAGYRIIESGKEVKVANLANLPIDGKAQVAISINSGLVTLKLSPQVPVTFRTKLAEVSPYVSVSSGTAVFSIDP